MLAEAIPEEYQPLFSEPQGAWFTQYGQSIENFYQALRESECFKAAVRTALKGIRHTLAFNVALNQCIYAVYAVLYFAAAVRLGIDYLSHYVQVFIVIAISIALPGVYGQWCAYQKLLAEMLEGKKVSIGALYKQGWFQHYNKIANNFSTAIVGWNLIQELSTIWRNTFDEQTVDEYWRDSISYTWRLPFAGVMFLLMFYYNRYYLGSRADRAKPEPAIGFRGGAFLYAVGNYFMAALPIMRYFIQQMKAGVPFDLRRSTDFGMVIHLIASALTSLPLRTMMYTNFFRDNHVEARLALLPNDSSINTLRYESFDPYEEEDIKKSYPYAASAFATATAAGQCYLSILGTSAVFNDAIPIAQRSELIHKIIEAYIVGNNVLSTGVAACLRYHHKWALR